MRLSADAAQKYTDERCAVPLSNTHRLQYLVLLYYLNLLTDHPRGLASICGCKSVSIVARNFIVADADVRQLQREREKILHALASQQV